jgi:hypothetical protein
LVRTRAHLNFWDSNFPACRAERAKPKAEQSDALVFGFDDRRRSEGAREMQIKPVLWCPYRALMFLGGASLALGFILAALQAA